MLDYICEVSFYVISCGMAMIYKFDLDFFLQISVYVLFIEIIKHCFIVILDETNIQRETVILDYEMPIVEKKGKIPIVNSVMVYKMCEGLGLNVQRAPVEKRKTWILKFNEESKCVTPTIASEIKEQNNKLNSPKIIPVVKSASVFKFCIALGIEAVLDPLQD
ncbi:hypothetical protein NPIL_505711 [Nephila pilipes]|uniref:Uncharacterized protein n=1 Tax=Nephila pilipes TaxID=299642 RepID=A0A8X6TUD7_NEPPI|nr:hypothetical protein NPIL_505711 [Nephila pilipes]